jgi:hypothetical protein
MTCQDTPPAAPAIDSAAGFDAALRWAIDAAVSRRARRLLFVDPDFSAWPLDDAALHGMLVDWLRQPGRRLVLVAMQFGEMPRRHPRFEAWRRDWAHVVEGWAPAPDSGVELPTLVVDDGPVVVRLQGTRPWRGRAAIDAREARACRDEVDALLQRCEAAWPVRPLGL